MRAEFLRPLILAGYLLLNAGIAPAQETDALVEQIYQTLIDQEKLYQSLYPYTYKQEVHFQKLDDDGEAEEASRREYLVRVLSEDDHRRSLIRALDFEDGDWTDVTADKRNEPQEGDRKKFSLLEMVGPENRHDYTFSSNGHGDFNGQPVYYIHAQVKDPQEDKFNGDLWVHEKEFIVVKAVLEPSALPSAVDSMQMEFELLKTSGCWLPARVILNAKISFLIIFSGRIRSDIRFYDYQFTKGK